MFLERVCFELRLESSKTVGFANCTWKCVPDCRSRDREASSGRRGFQRRHYEQSLVWRTQCANRHVWLQHSVQAVRLTVRMWFETECGHFESDPASNRQPVKFTKQIYGVLVTFADIANHTCQTVLHELHFIDNSMIKYWWPFPYIYHLHASTKYSQPFGIFLLCKWISNLSIWIWM